MHALGSTLELFAGEISLRRCGSSGLPSSACVQGGLVCGMMGPERMWHKCERGLALPEDLTCTLDYCCSPWRGTAQRPDGRMVSRLSQGRSCKLAGQAVQQQGRRSPIPRLQRVTPAALEDTEQGSMHDSIPSPQSLGFQYLDECRPHLPAPSPHLLRGHRPLALSSDALYAARQSLTSQGAGCTACCRGRRSSWRAGAWQRRQSPSSPRPSTPRPGQ